MWTGAGCVRLRQSAAFQTSRSPDSADVQRDLCGRLLSKPLRLSLNAVANDVANAADDASNTLCNAWWDAQQVPLAPSLPQQYADQLVNAVGPSQRLEGRTLQTRI
mmetsp:Transcript_8321/g.25190  ORF Transcript_8321/g.25190 Transcript_8321/m.25190 type:complete len:106 (-) Transcript_8321:431-748(-)